MNAKDKFSLGNCAEIIRLKDVCYISHLDTFFIARRKVIRGLEEHLAKGETDHDYINGIYVYKLTINGFNLYIRLEPEWVAFGSSIII